MRRWRQLAIIASAAGWLFAAGPAAAAQPDQGAKAPRNFATQIERLIKENSARIETVGFADRALPRVNIVRGTIRPSVASGTVEIVSFVDLREPPVRVVRGGAGLSTAALARDRPLTAPRTPHADDEMVVAFADPRQRPVTVLRGNAYDFTDTGLFAPAESLDLDRVAFAVDGAEFEPRRGSANVAGGPRRAAGADAGLGGCGVRSGRRRPL